MSAVAKAPKASSSTTAPPVADPLPDLLARLRLTALRDRLDGLLDEIDTVLESNAEEFVKGFVQKGGQ